MACLQGIEERNCEIFLCSSSVLSSFLDNREEFVHGYFSDILVETREEPDFQVNPRVNGAVRKTPEPVKGYPLEGADE